MKKNHLLYNIIIIFLLIISCKQEKTILPLEFAAYAHNPVLTKGPPGSWDELFIALPCVVKQDNIFYLFYMGCNVNGVVGIGLATSSDGFHFTKSERNPVLAPGSNGFDAFSISEPVLLNQDSVWVMYYNGSETVRWGPGPFVGRATARELTGLWTRDTEPVLTRGSMGEWDAGSVSPCSVLKMKDGSYRMYYFGGSDFSIHENNFIGMAYSRDGINWKKHNDPSTDQHPFLESDPVFVTGAKQEWDGTRVLTACVFRDKNGYKMYYTGNNRLLERDICGIGFASSKDGIRWDRYPGNPVYSLKNDPYSVIIRNNQMSEGNGQNTTNETEGPWLVLLDTVCLMYYDYGPMVGEIGVAVSPVSGQRSAVGGN